MIGKILGLTKKAFVRNVIILSSGTILAQALSLILTPVITRIYGPEAYGVMGMFNAIIAILMPVAALTYPIAIVIQKKDRDAKYLAVISIIIAGLISVLTFLVIAFSKKYIVQIFNLEQIESYLFLIPLVILFAAFSQVLQQWLIRIKQFRVSARVALMESLIMNGTKVGIGLMYPVASVLVIISAFGQGIRAVLIGIFLKRTGEKLPFKYSDFSSMRKIADEYKDFPIFRAPQVFLNAFSDNLPVVLLSSFFGPVAVGFYTLGRSILTLPSNLIGNAIGDVFYPRISDAANNNENLTRLIKRAIISLAAVAIIPFGIIALVGPWLFSLIFGDQWGDAGEYARWISLLIFSKFIYQPCIKAFPVLSAQAFHLKFTIINLVLSAVALLIGYYIFSSDLIAIILFSICGAFLNFILIFITLRISNQFDCGKKEYL
ncbi:oligosaccharide flippase family protein [Priestia endophytica]|uniref:oligosaccharide flippase family protein n=1 Tax=Priestia endophytica TaxID=135735 RepID=UPI00155971D6|nr:oligosaccharide flippase family protein [Priestia endophytica]